MTKDALKRLEAIAQLEDLGAGFMLATHDLEIRGAGELLSDDQSGQIEILATLYTDMLEQAVESLKNGQEPTLEGLTRNRAEIGAYSCFVTVTILPMLIFARTFISVLLVAIMMNNSRIFRLSLSIGLACYPRLQNLIAQTRIRNHSEALGIRKIDMGNQGGTIELVKQLGKPETIIGLIQKCPNHYREDRLRVTQSIEDQSRLRQCSRF